MGVRGLTGYIHERQHTLATTLVLSCETKTPSRPIVVDAWSFIYKVFYEAKHPWVYGGEYELFARDIANVVGAWEKMGLEPHFVFDGPGPAIKFPEEISRIQGSRINPANAFFQTSAVSRNEATFLRNKRIIPPLCYGACVSILRDMNVHCVWADAEADLKCVQLAASLGTWVIATDSDFSIFNAEGYKGYIPMDKIIWGYRNFRPAISTAKPNGKWVPKGGRAPTGDSDLRHLGLLPPSSGSLISIKFIIYHPGLLANHLKIPIAVLPLLSSLVGNDFVPKSYRPQFWERGRPSVGFVDHVASVLREVLSSRQDSRSRIGKQVAEIMVSRGEMDSSNPSSNRPSMATLIQTAIQELLLQPVDDAGIQEMVETIISATLQYDDNSNPMGPFANGVSASPHPDQEAVRLKYTEAYNTGDLSPQILEIVSSGTTWPNLFLEDPDVESCSRKVGLELVAWVVAILNDGLILGARTGVDSAAPGSSRNQPAIGNDEAYEVEFVDVVRELRRPRREQHPLGGSQEISTTMSNLHSASPVSSFNANLSITTPSVMSPPEATSITAYYRLGLRVDSQRLAIQTLSSLFPGQASRQTSRSAKWSWRGPIQLQSLDLRMEIFLHALQCKTDKIRALHPDWVVLVAALRWAIMKLGGRARVGGPPRSSDATKWKKSDAKAFLMSCVQSTSVLKTSRSSSNTPLEAMPRAIQLTSQILTSIEATQHLCQALLLTSELKTRGAERRFSGLRFHELLAGEKHVLSKEEGALVSRLFEAVEEDSKTEWWGSEDVPRWRPKPRPMQQTLSHKSPIGSSDASSNWRISGSRR